MDDAIITLAETKADLIAIKDLQQKNIRGERNSNEIIKDGFVTIEYSLEELRDLSGNKHHVVIKQGDAVLGYALYVPRESFVVRKDLGHLSHVTQQSYGVRHNWCIMGQVCIGAALRGKGYFRKMYNFMRETYKDRHDGIITDISSKNPRSMSAHLSVGFHLVESYKDDSGTEWHIVAWPWNKP